MKPASSFMLLLFLYIGTLCSTMNGYAQDYRPSGSYIFSPSHPLMEKQIYIREKADEVVFKDFNTVGEEIPRESLGYKTKRSSDGLTDMVDYLSCTITTNIYTYGSDQKLLIEQFNIDLPYYVYYTYDERGRVLSTTGYINPNQQGVFEIKTYTYLDNQTIYTDSGYIHTICREIRKWPNIIWGNLDSVIIKKDTSTTEYIFDEQTRLIRSGNRRHTYLSDGEILSTTINKQEEQKYESLYDSNGLLKRSNNYTWNNDKWELEKYTLVTHYKDGAPLSNGSIIEPESIQVYETRGGVVITSETQQSVRIYSITGQLVKQLQPISSEYIPLPRGLYIVKIKNQTQKVYVQ